MLHNFPYFFRLPSPFLPPPVHLPPLFGRAPAHLSPSIRLFRSWIVRTALQPRTKTKFTVVCSSSAQNFKLCHFTLLVVHRRPKKCTKKYNARTGSLFCHQSFCFVGGGWGVFCDVLVSRRCRVCALWKFREGNEMRDMFIPLGQKPMITWHAPDWVCYTRQNCETNCTKKMK